MPILLFKKVKQATGSNRIANAVTKSIWLVFSSSLMAGQVFAGPTPPVLVGKQEWLFYKYELSDSSQDDRARKSQELISSFERVLASRGIRLTVVMVPIKMRVYSEFLPENHKLSEYLQGHYTQMLSVFVSAGVNAADINGAFMSSTERKGDSPLFFRLDSHWTPAGAMVAALEVKKSLESDAKSAELLATVQAVKYTLKIDTRKRKFRGRDLADQLPKSLGPFDAEQVASVKVIREKQLAVDAQGAKVNPEISLVGSNYSREWTGFSDAIRYVLQRDVAAEAFGFDQGSWVGMISYLKDGAFQAKPPKLLIWEMPERDMHAPPDYKYREARYVMGNAEWLKRVTELVKKAPTVR